jgi:hypothetical protein
VGITETTVMVNELRAEKDEDSEPVSWSAVKHFIHICGVVRIHRRSQKKSGKGDSATAWAQARLAQALELQSRFRWAPDAPVAQGATVAPPGGELAVLVVELLLLLLRPRQRPPQRPLQRRRPQRPQRRRPQRRRPQRRGPRRRQLAPCILVCSWAASRGGASFTSRCGSATPQRGRSACAVTRTRERCVPGGEWDPEMPNTPIKYPGEARVCAGAVMLKGDGDRGRRRARGLQGRGPPAVQLHRADRGRAEGVGEGAKRGTGARDSARGLLEETWRRLSRALRRELGGASSMPTCGKPCAR